VTSIDRVRNEFTDGVLAFPKQSLRMIKQITKKNRGKMIQKNLLILELEFFIAEPAVCRPAGNAARLRRRLLLNMVMIPTAWSTWAAAISTKIAGLRNRRRVAAKLNEELSWQYAID
jgi:hypothetical protein